MNFYAYMQRLPYPEHYNQIVSDEYLPLEAIGGTKQEKLKYVQDKWYEGCGQEGWKEGFTVYPVNGAYKISKAYEEYSKDKLPIIL